MIIQRFLFLMIVALLDGPTGLSPWAEQLPAHKVVSVSALEMGGRIAATAIDSDTVYVATTTKDRLLVYSLDGEPQYSLDLPAAPRALAAAENRLAVATKSAEVYVVNLAEMDRGAARRVPLSSGERAYYVAIRDNILAVGMVGGLPRSMRSQPLGRLFRSAELQPARSSAGNGRSGTSPWMTKDSPWWRTTVTAPGLLFFS